VHAIHCDFTKIINGTTQFTIPVFQRDYTWAESNCEQLWNDIVRIASANPPRVHFLVSLVYVPAGGSSAGFTQYQVIDGQQRLTTWSLLMIALRDHIRETGFDGGDSGPTVARIDAYYLKNEQEGGKRRHKLVLRRHDQGALRALIDRTEMPSDGSEHIRDNYEFFRELLREVSPTLIYEGLGRLIVVDVKLDATDDPQLVFESLNSTGVDLSQTDLIRNFLLMRLPEGEQDRLYEHRWSKIEALFRGFDRMFDAFARDYVALRMRASKQEKADNVYRAFRDAFDVLVQESGGLDELLEHMQATAGYYAAFSLSHEISDTLKWPMSRLSKLVDVPAILIMRMFECYKRLGTLSEGEFKEALSLLESYILRRSVCGGQTRGYWQVFADMAYELNTKQPLESLKGLLATQHESYAFPADAEFQRNLVERDLYHMRNCFHILEHLENHASREPSDTSNLEIEHIMPQNPNLNAAWQAMLGSECRDVQQKWLHRLGNLTLTGYNSKYSDRSFIDKKTIEGGFSDSAVRLNKSVREQEKWTDEEMLGRSALLAAQAAKVWPPLVVDVSVVKQIEQDRLRQRAAKRNVAAVPMGEPAKALFEALRGRVLNIDPNATEMAESKSVSYHGPGFFLEVLPRKRCLTLLLPLDFNEVQDVAGIASDATQWNFIPNAQYAGGVLLRVQSPADLDLALPVIRQAHASGRAAV
jgi:predicted transport protein